MSTSLLKIAGGTVYDPANGVDGEVRDLWIEGGKIVAPPSDPKVRPVRTIDANGLVVMPGGIDMHCHIAGPKVNAARRMRPDKKGVRNRFRREDESADVSGKKTGGNKTVPDTFFRSGTLGSVPSTFVTGYKYAALGYTTAFDAAVSPLDARHAHAELADTPCLDKGFFVLMGNNHYAMRAIRDREPERLRAFVAWLLGAAKGFAPKLVNPGGVEMWKQRAGGNLHGLDEQVEQFDVTPREILAGIAQAAGELGLPHPVHIHCNNLGVPGNWTTTLETMKALEGRRGHLTHIQFHSYGGGEGDEATFSSKTAELAEYVNAHDNITVDVGQVLFGKTTSMTGDGPLGYFLSRLYGGPWYSRDVEMESGCGISPIAYKNKNLVNALQWAIGLEWYLSIDDPWRVAMSTDHPNGGSFLAYPQIIRLLMDRSWRRDVLATCHPKIRERSVLADLDREYTLGEIAIITRAAPARMLGLANKGHLAPGADADVTIYMPDEDKERMFSLPRMVVKRGEVIFEEGELRAAPDGRTLHVAPEYDEDMEDDIRDWFNERSSVRFGNYAVGAEEVGEAEAIATV